ncbi:hypothetical protein CHS0354_032191 [Potamilus streckersoni]|uniref:Uncharacterized protein n=1 Tax=Potamilus streckersoni TaxID=2493646 RepID=A0AAE0WCX8_9BIVA|nr:hypothetical protein CHS0354_032191 [Potamilus streckersoni]
MAWYWTMALEKIIPTSSTLVFTIMLLYRMTTCFNGDNQCQSNAHVCTSLMKYPDEQVFNEGPYCKCPGCTSSWQEDRQSLTWPHYERADKTVQYRFCIPIIPDKDCQLDELAVTMETETDGWSPHVREVRCACPGNIYELVGWWRHKTHLSNNMTGLWIYEYYCHKPSCETDKSLCAKIYMDKEHEMTVGYHFQCACPKGYKCPSDIEDDDKLDYSNDSRGVYVPRYCEAVFKNART